VRILFIHNRYRYEGGEDVAVELEVKLLKQKGHDVEVLLFDNYQISTTVNRIKAGLQAFYNFSSAQKTADAIDCFKPEVIHIHNLFFIASPSVLYIAKKYRVPVIITVHNYRLVCSNALLIRNNQVCELCVNKTFPLAGIRYKCYRNSTVESAFATSVTGIHKLLKTWSKYVSQYIALTHFAKNKLLASSLNLKEQQLSVVSNFVPDEGQPSWPREGYFLYVGRLAVEKGLPVLIKAFAELKSESLIIIGDGPQRKELEEESFLHPNIQFLGKKNKTEVLDFLGHCAALVFPSICYEGMPYTILEAFSMGTPVIASNLGAMAEMINDGYNGFLFEPGDSASLKDCLLKFKRLGGQENVLSRQARLTYEKSYHPKIHYNAIMSIYQKAIETYKKK
jgi:glycosyltransferase involved in cell wall biosynthesis